MRKIDPKLIGIYIFTGLSLVCGLRTIPELIGRIWLFMGECHFVRFVNHVDDFYFKYTYIDLGAGIVFLLTAIWLARSIHLKSLSILIRLSIFYLICFITALSMQPLGILITYGDFIERQHQ